MSLGPLCTRRDERGMTTLEMLIALTIAFLLLLCFTWGTSLYRKGLVRAAASQFVATFANGKKVASQSAKGICTIVFRPTDALYTSYRVITDQGEEEFRLSGGVRIVNTNGLIRNHMLRISITGAVVNEFGDPVTAPNPGLITFVSDETTRLYVVRINPQTGLPEVL